MRRGGKTKKKKQTVYTPGLTSLNKKVVDKFFYERISQLERLSSIK